LTQDAARQIFVEIADDGRDMEDIDKVLALTGNMPLAIDLLSHLVASESCNGVLSRWETERTSIVSKGYDRRSNLDLSISLSLSSPRITSIPHVRDLLSLLSTLPEGLSDVDFRQSKLPINNILSCKSVLLGTSLLYLDVQGRLKLLVPIREFMHKFYPTPPSLIESLLAHFTELLDIQRTYSGDLKYIGALGIFPRITSNAGNIEALFLQTL
jgi:hypothetical protein